MQTDMRPLICSRRMYYVSGCQTISGLLSSLFHRPFTFCSSRFLLLSTRRRFHQQCAQRHWRVSLCERPQAERRTRHRGQGRCVRGRVEGNVGVSARAILNNKNIFTTRTQNTNKVRSHRCMPRRRARVSREKAVPEETFALVTVILYSETTLSRQ